MESSSFPPSGFLASLSLPWGHLLCALPKVTQGGAHSTTVEKGLVGTLSHTRVKLGIMQFWKEWLVCDKDPSHCPQAKLPNLKEVDVRYTEAW
jgi:hypothetical protein